MGLTTLCREKMRAQAEHNFSRSKLELNIAREQMTIRAIHTCKQEQTVDRLPMETLEARFATFERLLSTASNSNDTKVARMSEI
jgi:hypothetical protein